MKTLIVLLLSIVVLLPSCSKTTNIHLTSNGVSNATITADYLGFDSYGQSLSVGGDAGKLAYIATTTQKYNSVMPNLGTRSLDYPKQTPVSFIPLVERLNVNSTMGETLCAGACEMFAQTYPDAPFILHGVASGCGGQTVAQLSKGTSHYTQYLKDITSAYNTAQAMGNTYSLGMSGWTQGEADITAGTSYDVYRSSVQQLQADLNVDVSNITHQQNTVPFIVGQTSSNNRSSASMTNPQVALAQLDLCINDSNFTLAAPMYFFDFLSDNTHLSGTNYRILAAYYGYASKRLIVDGVKNFVYLTQASVVNNDLYLVFNVPVAPLMFDTIQVVNPGSYGFVVKNSTGGKMKLTNIEILGGDSVHITCLKSPAGGTVTYAINGTTKRAGRTAGPRGCLKDSQGDSLIFDPGDSSHTNFPLYNWCPIFKVQL